MTRSYCDRCKQETKSVSETYCVGLVVKVRSGRDLPAPTQWDVCTACLERLQSAFRDALTELEKPFSTALTGIDVGSGPDRTVIIPR